MIDRYPQTAHNTAEGPTDWEALMEGYDWKINVPTDPDDPSYREGLDIIAALKERYGSENVIVNLAVMEPDTGRLNQINGKFGVHVRADAQPSDSI